MIRVALGTKENVAVTVTDITGGTTSLAAATPLLFDVLNAAGTALISGSTPTVNTMTLYCLCDFSNTATFPVGDYRLFVKFTVGTETPRLGPFNIQIVATLIEG
jgi:hypothetical protein